MLFPDRYLPIVSSEMEQYICFNVVVEATETGAKNPDFLVSYYYTVTTYLECLDGFCNLSIKGKPR